MSGADWGQVLVGVLTAAGALGGVALGGWLNARRDRTLWERQQSDRRQDLCRTAYAEFVVVATECRRLLQQLFYFQQVRRDREILAVGDEYNKKNRELSQQAANIQLIGSAALADAADRVIDACADFVSAIRDVEPVATASSARTDLAELEKLRASVRGFIAEARAEVLRAEAKAG